MYKQSFFLLFLAFLVASCTSSTKERKKIAAETDEAILKKELPKLKKLQQEGLGKTAISRYLNLLNTKGDRAVYQYLYAKTLSNPEKQWTHFNRCVLINEQFYPCLIERGRIYTAWKIWDRAEKDFQAAKKLRPSSKAHEAGLASIALAKGNYPRAIRFYKQIYASNPNNQQSVLGLGNAYKLQGKTSDAISWFKKFVAMDKTMFRPLFDLCFLLIKQKRKQEALPYLKRAHKLSPKNFPVLSNLADITLASNKRQEALGYYKKASEHPRATVKIFSSLGRLYRSFGMYPKAIQALNKAYQANKEDKTILLDLTNLYMDRRNYEQVEFLMETALRTQPNNMGYHRFYVKALEGRKQYIKLLKALQRAVKTFSQVAEFKNKLNQTLQNLGVQMTKITGGGTKKLARKANRRIGSCYKKRVSVLGKELKGKMVFDVRILNSGTRIRFKREKSTIKDAVIEACIKWTYQLVEFPDKGIAIEQTLNLPL